MEAVLEGAGKATQRNMSDKIGHVLPSLPEYIATDLDAALKDGGAEVSRG